MRLGAVFPQAMFGQVDPDAVVALVQRLEDAGYDHLLIYDHVLGADVSNRPGWTGFYDSGDPFLEPLVLFAYLARSCGLELVTDVLVLPQRQTALVAKQVADLDLMSGERLRFGIGVGWNYVEYQALGQAFKTRGARADEQIALLRRYWSEPLVSFKGRFDEVDRGNILPRPRRPIPIWIGGFQEPAFRRGGYLGDGFMFAGDDPLAHFARVKHHLAAAGRTLDGYGLDFITNVSRTVDAAVNAADMWREAGGTHISVCTMGMGFTTAEQHIDFMTEVKARLLR